MCYTVVFVYNTTGIILNYKDNAQKNILTVDQIREASANEKTFQSSYECGNVLALNISKTNLGAKKQNNITIHFMVGPNVNHKKENSTCVVPKTTQWL